MSKYLIIGGNSDIALEFVKILLKNNHEIVMSSNDYERLLINTKKLENEYNKKIKTLHINIENFNSFDKIITNLDKDIECIFFSCGYLEKKNINLEKIKKINYEGPKVFIEKILKVVKLNKIIAITSISADRIDYKSRTYSYSKKLFTDYLNSLNNKEGSNDIDVKIIMPGYVKTKMIKDLSIIPLLTIAPKKLACNIYSVLNNKQKKIVTPKYWLIIIFFFNLIFFFKNR